MANYTLDNKIYWVREYTTEKSHEDTIYNSLTKLLKKKLPILQATFEYHIHLLTDELVKDIFIPVYKKYVVSKPSYNLNEEIIYENFKRFVSEKKKQYYLIWVTKIGEVNSVCGATIFNISIKNNKKTCSFSYKGYDHSITRELKIGISLDIWTESIVQDFALLNNCKQLLHGRDTHFRENPGVHLFKLKMGCLPVCVTVSKKIGNTLIGTEKIHITDEDINKNNLSVFFDSPNEEGYYTQLRLYYKLSSDNPSLYNEFKIIGTKFGLEVIATEY